MTAERPVHRLVVKDLQSPIRLDSLLRNYFPNWGRHAVGRLIHQRKVQVNGRWVWLSSWQVANGDSIAIFDHPPLRSPAPDRFDDDWLLAQEDDLIVVDKPAGLLSQSTRAQQPGDLLSLAIERFGMLHLVHRLDRDTSGVVLLSRPGPINRYLDEMFKTHAVEKRYLAVVRRKNRLKDSGTIDLRIDRSHSRRDRMAVSARGGRRAVTHYRVLGTAEGQQLVLLTLVTGRTHQIRVHLNALDATVVGDRYYGTRSTRLPRLLLHAFCLTLPQSEGYPERRYFAPLPEDFMRLMAPSLHACLEKLGNSSD